LGAEQRAAPVGEVGRAGQELRDRGELVGVEPLEQLARVGGQRVEHLLDLAHRLGRGAQHLLAPVVRMGLAAQPARPLQPRDHPGDRAAGQAGDRGELTGGHRGPLPEQVQALEVGGAQPEAIGEGMVEQHGGGAVPAGE
jgi:hypothetical protein